MQVVRLKFVKRFIKLIKITNCVCVCVCGRDVPCRQKDGRTLMTKLIVAFSDFSNAPKNPIIQVRRRYSIKICLSFI